jgi:DNA replication protein DnaC
VLEGRLEAAAQKQLRYADFLADLLSTETAARRERYLCTRTRLAHLPFQRTLDQFDFRFQPSIDKRQVRDLATLTFISEAANVLFLGPPGVGKTHLAIALGLRAIEQGSGVYFVRAHASSTSSACGPLIAWRPPPSSRSSPRVTSAAASS